jgi:hypothetical protein
VRRVALQILYFVVGSFLPPKRRFHKLSIRIGVLTVEGNGLIEKRLKIGGKDLCLCRLNSSTGADTKSSNVKNSLIMSHNNCVNVLKWSSKNYFDSFLAHPFWRAKRGIKSTFTAKFLKMRQGRLGFLLSPFGLKLKKQPTCRTIKSVILLAPKTVTHVLIGKMPGFRRIRPHSRKTQWVEL